MNGPEPVERFRAIRIVQGVIGNARSGMHAVSADAVRLSVFVGVCRGLVGVCRRVPLRLLAGAFGTPAVEPARCVIGLLVDEAVAQPTVQTAAAAKAEAWSGPANGVQGSVTPMPRNAPDRAAANTPRHRSQSPAYPRMPRHRRHRPADEPYRRWRGIAVR